MRAIFRIVSHDAVVTMYELFYWPTPNGWKITIFFEETGLPYKVVPIDITAGEQFDPAFLAISPNNKMPALRDPAGPGGQPYTVFESGAMLLYLAEKTGHFWPTDMAERYRMMSWLMFQMGTVGPMLGQYHHFSRYAKDKNQTYAEERYANERLRLYSVIDRQLAENAYLAGDSYGLADIATFPWIMPEAQHVDVAEFPNLKRWHEVVNAREAVQRGLAVSRELRQQSNQMDEKSKEILFGQKQYARR